MLFDDVGDGVFADAEVAGDRDCGRVGVSPKTGCRGRRRDAYDFFGAVWVCRIEAPVRGDAPADLGATGPGRLTRGAYKDIGFRVCIAAGGLVGRSGGLPLSFFKNDPHFFNTHQSWW